jgi:uncharacterized repeat protein (TIGR01451 family)
MSRRVQDASRRVAVLVTLFGVASLALAGSGSAGPPAKRVARVARPTVLAEDAAPSVPVAGSPSVRATGVAGPPNDTCSGAVALTLNQRTKGSTVGANDDYHAPADASCFPGDQFPTNATGRDVVFSFTAPADGAYSFKSLQLDPTVTLNSQDTVLYLTDDCTNPGTVNCLAGANHSITPAFTSSKGANNNRGDMIACFPMGAGQTVYLIYDDGIAGRCADDNHTCFTDADCNTGASCTPQLNAGTDFGVEVKPCNPETEPNDTPALANPYVCDMVGNSAVAPIAHCYLGTRAGNVCTRSTFLDQSLPDRNMRCSISGTRCQVDAVLGTDNCGAGNGICQSQTDLDCDPRCDVGPNAGYSCASQAFCNPVSDQGATCAGSCQVESTCIDTTTGADTGVACTPVCVGGLFPGRYCSSLSGCPGGGVCTTTPAVGSPGATCAAGQTCGRQYNEGDTDYFAIGSPVAGSKVFAGVDAIQSNDFDFRMRITTATNTLQMDDDDVTSWYGQNAPTIAGALTDGSPTFIQISRTTPRAAGPYELYAIVRPPLAAAQLEDESGPTGNDIYFGWPGDVINANPINNGANNGYVRGTFAFQGDSDCFKFLVSKGDLMDWFGDSNPTRANTGVSAVDQPQPIIYDAEPAGISNFVFGVNARKNTSPNVQGAGLRALTPAVTSSYFQWRASYTGMLEVCYYGASALLGTGTPNHPNSWAGSLGVNCGPVQAAGPGTTTADVSITKDGPTGPVETGAIITYTITVTNNGSAIAQEVEIQDTLDPNLAFVSLNVDDTLGGNNTACFSLPSQGLADAPIDCINTSMAPGSSTVYTLTVQVNNCIGDGVSISNTASIVTSSTDPDNSNDSSTNTFTTAAQANNGCTPIACDGLTCIPDLCTVNDHCDAGVCVFDTANCDDNNVCTDDSCDPAVGCINDSSSAGDLCDDGNPCTLNACDPVLFCVFPPGPQGVSCDDGLACTTSDHCDAAGNCAGTSVCDDGDPCTDDFADEANACACSHGPAALGTACNDNDACTGTGGSPDACDGNGACAGGQAVNCDDGNACTADTCDPALGCVHTSITCDDGNVCNGVETCDPASGCVAGTPLVCNDGNACNGVETCNPATGCVSGTPPVCNDGNACNGIETCNPASGCVAGTPLVCNDGDACNGVETCNPASGCVAGVPVVCTALDSCHDVGTCDAGTGTCSNPLKAAGSACDDANACTTGTTCDAGGTCGGGTAVVCPDDGDPCTANVCVPTSGCQTSATNLDTAGFSATRVDGRDLVILADAWNACASDPNYDAAANLDQVGCVDLVDFHLFMNAFGQSCP